MEETLRVERASARSQYAAAQMWRLMAILFFIGSWYGGYRAGIYSAIVVWVGASIAKRNAGKKIS